MELKYWEVKVHGVKKKHIKCVLTIFVLEDIEDRKNLSVIWN